MAGQAGVEGLRIGVKRSKSVYIVDLYLMFILYVYLATAPNIIHSTLLIFEYMSPNTGGCSGYSYNMNYVKTGDETIKQDELVEQFGVNVYVDPKAIFFIVGTEMDYVVSVAFAIPSCSISASAISTVVSFKSLLLLYSDIIFVNRIPILLRSLFLRTRIPEESAVVVKALTCEYL
jgi:hypothetical protein